MAYRALFLGSIDPVPIAAMHAWVDAGHEIAAFWRAGSPTRGPIKRDRRLSFLLPRWSVAGLIRRHPFPIRDVYRLASWPQAAAEARASGADVLISAYFRYLVPSDMLAVFGTRAVNFHPAPLPRYRGPHPLGAMVIDRSIETEGAMTLHVLNAEFDEGPVIASLPVPFRSDLSLARYELALANAAARLSGEALPQYLAGALPAIPQDDSQATYARLAPGDLGLKPNFTADEIRWRCNTFATLRPLPITGVESARAIGFRDVVGPPSGDPPSVGLLSVAFDAADARVRVWRKMPLTRHVRRLGRLIDLARAPATARS